ncbi:glycerate kinase [Paenibacillus flagellatus]|uniref:Glycerate kinase n=1 Tax=Paenibacillus flagellatus TaxID=2211139 RepID=A0A2V5K2Z7_9BACL|nr:glycerate kinase [Paenibacillus flagellatus]PYI52992.1 glycerate kinase [Paenibacillus flagellatus]
MERRIGEIGEIGGEDAFRVVIAPDSFKGSISSVAAAEAIRAGVLRAAPDAGTTIVPMADGGEGTVDAVLAAVGGERLVVPVEGPLGGEVMAAWGLLADGRTAVIEMAAASGLPLVAPEARDPLAATTYGTGQLIRAALDRGATRLLIGLGGSATNDGGMGMAQALGVRFADADGRELAGRGCGALLERIASIDASGLDPRFAAAEVTVLSDVTNPLCGPDGASAVYGPQKGATPEAVERLDRGLAHYAERIAAATGRDVRDAPGAGAAGGLGAGLLAFGRAVVKPGIAVVTELAGFDRAVAGAALVITGEGRTDAQTAYGKVPAGVAAAARPHGVPVVCLSGGLGAGAETLYGHGIAALFSIANRPLALDEAMRDAEPLLAEAAENVVRLYRAAAGFGRSRR